jgi:hypothetical protein
MLGVSFRNDANKPGVEQVIGLQKGTTVSVDDSKMES